MLATLKDIFRPTWKKLACTFALSLVVGLLIFLLAAQRHRLEWQEGMLFGLNLPLIVARSLPIVGDLYGTPISLPIIWMLQLFYYYTIVCVAAFSLRLVKRTRR